MLKAILIRDFRINVRNFSSLVNLASFFIISFVTIIISSVGDSKSSILYHQIGIGAIWSMFLLSSILAMDNIFEQDYRDGSLRILMLQGYFTEILILAKSLSYFLFTIIPLLITIPIIAIFININIFDSALLMLPILIGALIICLVNVLIASLTLNISSAKNIMGFILVIPIILPVIILSINAMTSLYIYNDIEKFFSYVTILLALFLVFCPLTIFLGSYAIKINFLDN